MTSVLVRIWKLIRGPLQWYALWIAHHKFIIGVSGVMLNTDNNILLLRHRYWKDGSWGLPSGYAIREETLQQTICREINEETGLKSEVTSLLRIRSGFKLRLEVTFLGRIIGGDIKIDKREIIELAFFPLNELPGGLLESHRELLSENIDSILHIIQA